MLKIPRPWRAALLLFLTVSALSAATITDTDGYVYRDAKVIQVEPDGLRVEYAQGVAKIPFEKMPATLREKYHIDAGRAYVYRDSLAHPQNETTSPTGGLTIQPAAPTSAGQPRPPAKPGSSQGSAASAGPSRPAYPWPPLPLPNTDKSIFHLLSLIAMALLSFSLYFLPSWFGLKKKSCLAIFLVNFFLGWTLIGWVVALVWALIRKPGEEIEAQKNAPTVKLILAIFLGLNLCSAFANYFWGDQIYQMLKAMQEKQATLQAAPR